MIRQILWSVSCFSKQIPIVSKFTICLFLSGPLFPWEKLRQSSLLDSPFNKHKLRPHHILGMHLWTGAIAVKKTDQMPCPFGAYIPARWRQTINKHVCLFAGDTRDLRKKSPDTQVLSSPEVISRQEAVSFSTSALLSPTELLSCTQGTSHAGKWVEKCCTWSLWPLLGSSVGQYFCPALKYSDRHGMWSIVAE